MLSINSNGNLFSILLLVIPANAGIHSITFGFRIALPLRSASVRNDNYAAKVMRIIRFGKWIFSIIMLNLVQHLIHIGLKPLENLKQVQVDVNLSVPVLGVIPVLRLCSA